MKRVFDRLIYLVILCLIVLSVAFALYHDGIISPHVGTVIEAAYVPSFSVFLALLAINALLKLFGRPKERAKRPSDEDNASQKPFPAQEEIVLPIWVDAFKFLRWGFVIIGVGFSFSLQKNYPLMLGLACFITTSWFANKALRKADPALANTVFRNEKKSCIEIGFGRGNDGGDGGD